MFWLLLWTYNPSSCNFTARIVSTLPDATEAEMLDLESLPPALNPEQIRKRQEAFKALQQTVAEHKPLLDKLVKAGGALLKLVGNDEGRKLAELIDADVDRFENIKVI